MVKVRTRSEFRCSAQLAPGDSRLWSRKQSLEQTRGKVRGFKNAGIKVDIMKEFRLRDVFLGENGGNEI